MATRLEGTSGVEIRFAEPKDEAGFRAMWDDFVALDTEKCPQSATDHIWQSVLDRGSALRRLIADRTSEAVGFLLYTTHDYSRSLRKACYLLDFYVEPASRGLGLGRALIERLAGIGRELGWLKISWLTQPDNVDARRLYDTFGKVSPLVRYDMQLSSYEVDGGDNG